LKILVVIALLAQMSFIYISFKRQATYEQRQQMIQVRFSKYSTKATSLVTDLFPEGKIEKSHEKIIYPIADGIKLQHNSSILQASV
jgi:hypothetical protein